MSMQISGRLARPRQRYEETLDAPPSIVPVEQGRIDQNVNMPGDKPLEEPLQDPGAAQSGQPAQPAEQSNVIQFPRQEAQSAPQGTDGMAASTAQPQQQPQDRLQELQRMQTEETRAMLDDMNTQVNDQDGRLRSGISAFFKQFNENLRARSAAGAPMNWGDFATLVASGVGGFVGGSAIRPQWNEERDKLYRIGERQTRLKHIDEAVKTEATARTQGSQARYNEARTRDLERKPGTEAAKGERDAAIKNLEQFPALDPKNPVHQKAIARAEAAGWIVDPQSWGKGNVQTAFDQETGYQMERDKATGAWKQSVDANGQPITTKTQKAGAMPDSFYALDGVDEKTIHLNAVKNAGAADFASKAELDPDKVNLLKQDGEDYDQAVTRIRKALEYGDIHLSEVVKDTQKEEARRYEGAVAAAEAGDRQRMNLYRQAVDQTSGNQSASLMSIAQFQQDYKAFYKLYNDTYKRSPEEAEKIRGEYFDYIKSLRLR